VPGKKVLLLILSVTSLVLPSLLRGQEVQIQSGFLQDSISIGEEVQYWITASYDPKVEILFPDSNFDFSPYEYLDKSFWPTQLRDETAFDSAVYALQSFEIDPVQYLDLPIYQFNGGDTSRIDSPTDSILFRPLVAIASDTTSMKENTQYLVVDRMVNYPLIWIIIGSLVFITIMVIVLFGNRIRRALLIRRMRKEYLHFSQKLTQDIQELKTSGNRETAEHTVGFWKNYLEKLESYPFSKLTTREILSLEHTKELSEALHNIDRSIYGNIEDKDLYKSFQSIEDFTQHRYQRKMQELKDGNRK
jgi:hypothetical protein